MLPFCGYNMGDYFAHWLELGSKHAGGLRRSFCVNWFRKDENGKFLWPGFGENSRVLEWIFRRVEGKAEAVDTPLGRVPAAGAINTEGLDVTDGQMAELVKVDSDQVKDELPAQRQHLAKFGDALPTELRKQLAALEERLRA